MDLNDLSWRFHKENRTRAQSPSCESVNIILLIERHVTRAARENGQSRTGLNKVSVVRVWQQHRYYLSTSALDAIFTSRTGIAIDRWSSLRSSSHASGYTFLNIRKYPRLPNKNPERKMRFPSVFFNTGTLPPRILMRTSKSGESTQPSSRDGPTCNSQRRLGIKGNNPSPCRLN